MYHVRVVRLLALKAVILAMLGLCLGIIGASGRGGAEVGIVAGERVSLVTGFWQESAVAI